MWWVLVADITVTNLNNVYGSLVWAAQVRIVHSLAHARTNARTHARTHAHAFLFYLIMMREQEANNNPCIVDSFYFSTGFFICTNHQHLVVLLRVPAATDLGLPVRVTHWPVGGCVCLYFLSTVLLCLASTPRSRFVVFVSFSFFFPPSFRHNSID